MKLTFTLFVSFGAFLATSTAQYTCSATQPCSIGCCSKGGVCGLGPTFCGANNCVSNCDRKSDCDPGWGSQWSNSESCPLNVCCSQYGFCGTTKDFCGTKTVVAPSCSGASSSKRTVAYYEGWSSTRACDQMYPEGIPIGAYTHLNFAFAFIDPNSFAVAPMSSSDPDLYGRFTSLKNTKPSLQTWISIGGWSMNDPDQPTASTFSTLAASADAQGKFFESLLSFLSTYDFDGVDIDWEYPVAPERSGSPADYKNYVTFLQNLRNALQASGHNYGVSITIPSSYWYMQHFDIVSIAKIIDWFNVMTYDLHGTWDSTDAFIGSYAYAHTNLTEIDTTLSLLWRNNIDPNKVALGLGFYGRSFTLADPSCTAAGCPFTSGGTPGPCTASAGTLSFAEIENIIAGGATVTLDQAAAVKLVVWDSNQWVSYDDADTLKLKVDYANSHCLGGTMVWASSLDDASGTAADDLSGSTGQILLSRSAKTLAPDPISSCQLGECGQNCGGGLSAAQRSDGKNRGNTGTNTGCTNGKTRLFCCPSNNMPTCTWRGTAPFCKGKCKSGEVEVTSSTAGTGKSCWTGHKVLCCTSTSSDAAIGECDWEGSAPFCAAPFKQASCSKGKKALTNSNSGAGGEQPCRTGSKSFCCDQPPPYQNCDWYYHGGSFGIPFRCSGTCPQGKSVIATDDTGCVSGYGAFCCDSPATTNDPSVTNFENLINTFAQNPVCAVGQRYYSKRGLEEEIRKIVENGTLSEADLTRLVKRSSLSKSDQVLLLGLLVQIFRGPGGNGQTYQQSLMAGVFNSSYGDQNNIHGSDFLGFYNEWPNMDPLSLTESLLCLGSSAAGQLTDAIAGQRTSCINPCSSRTRKRDGSQDYSALLHVIQARNLEDSANPTTEGPGGEPSWGFVMDAISNGRLTLVYEQLILLINGDTLLEVVWELPAGTGPGNIDPRYQDPDPSDSDTNPDRYVVFHFHVEHIAMADNQMLPGIFAIVAFHGQHYGDGQTPRVDGNDQYGRNRRARIMTCNTGDNSNEDTLFWYPGAYRDHQPPNGWGTRIQDFGNFLQDNAIIEADIFTNPTQGQLGLTAPDPCGRRYFEWGGYRRSRQFGPDSSGPPSEGDDETDNDGVLPESG